MATRHIATLGNPILKTVATTVDPTAISSKEIQRLITDMIETMHAAQGIGIAAPQVNVSLRIAIINERPRPFAIINPKIVRKSLRSETTEEGCLSIPGVFGTVRRPRSVTVAFLDERGSQQTRQASGLLARVFQHEIDHLNGVLFIDRMQILTRGTLP